jgi:hypothetical protein
MTEAEWLASNRREAMLEHLHGKASDRRLRLFACACCRRIWHLILDERGKKAAWVAERYADGLATDEERRVAWEAAWADDLPGDNPQQSSVFAAVHAGYFACHQPKWIYRAASSASDAVFYKTRETADEDHASDLEEAESDAQRSLLRDIFGNPFRPATLNPSWVAWNDGAIRKMAQGIYDARAFDRLPLLADALEEAGCDNADILSHCRGGGEHVRGCWVVDLLLGKS